MYWVYNNNVIEARILMINSSMGWAVWFDNVGVIWEYLLFFFYFGRDPMVFKIMLLLLYLRALWYSQYL